MDAARFACLRSEGGWFSVVGRSEIVVTGEDRLRYLNGQVSNDLRRLGPGSAMAALVLTAKGKLCADIFVWTEDASLVVECEARAAETLGPRLERYAIADDVAFAARGAHPRVHVFGPAARGLAGRTISRLGVEGIDCDDPPPGALAAAPDEVELLRIIHGIPQWGRELDEDTLPQEAGLETTSVDFDKGCYVGQEVVSRLRSVGRVNRRLHGFVGDFAPRIPAELRDADGNAVGRLTSAARAAAGRTVALGCLSTRAAGTRFSVHDESGACLGTAERSQFPLVHEA